MHESIAVLREASISMFAHLPMPKMVALDSVETQFQMQID
jgi:hypothetical protein